MKKRTVIALTAAGLMLCGLIALALGAADTKVKNTDDTIKIGLAIYLGDDTFISNLVSRFKDLVNDYEQDHDVRLHLSIADAQGSQPTQNGQIERFLSLGYDVLCVNLVDRTNAAYIIDKAMAANVPVVFFNREPVQADLQKWDRLYYVGTDAALNGRMEGQIVVDAYERDSQAFDKNGDGILQYIMIEGEIRHQDAVLRTEESIKTIREAGIEVIKLDGAIADWERSRAASLASQYFETYGEQIELIICNNDDMALGVIDAADSLGVSFDKIVGIDGTPPGLAAVKEGKMLGTVVIDYAAQAGLLFDATIALATNGMPENTLDVGEDRCIRAPMYAVTKQMLED